MKRPFVAVAVAFLSGCSTGGSLGARDGGADTSTTPVEGGADSPASSDAGNSGDGGIAWAPCGDLQCATIALPRDYDDPSLGTVQLAVTRSLAVPAKRIGVLFVNTGGPGEPVVSAFGGKTPTWLLSGTGTGLTDAFDVIGFDPRGIGQSAPAIHCYTDAATQAALAAPLDPGDAGQWASAFAAAQLFQQGCQANDDATLMARVDSATVARDIDTLRAMLGESTISYLGYSYGTLLGAVYATLFPSHLRAIALDSPVMSEPDRRGRYLALAPALEALLDQFFAWCATAPACSTFGPATGRTQASIAAAYDALIAQLDASPLPATAHAVDGAGVELATLSYLYNPPSAWPNLGPALAAAAAGDPSKLAPVIAGQVAPSDAASDNLDSAFCAVSGLDSPLPAGFTEQALESFLSGQVAPVGPRVGLIAAVNEAPTFVGWPYAPGKPLPVLSAPTAPPGLVSTTRYDIVPGSYATAMQAALGAGTSLLTYGGVGHVNAFSVPCIGQAILAYLLAPTAPPATTSCAAIVF